MKLVRIFDLPNPTLYAIQYNDELQDEYHRLFDLWTNAEYLFDFFSEHKHDLKYYAIDPAGAALESYELAIQMETSIEKACRKGNRDIGLSLQTLFKPLSNHETSVQSEHQRSKAKRKWLRFYAVRISPNCFVITGGSIKLTKTMEERTHTKKELGKMDRVISYLKEEALYDPEDFETLEF